MGLMPLFFRGLASDFLVPHKTQWDTVSDFGGALMRGPTFWSGLGTGTFGKPRDYGGAPPPLRGRGIPSQKVWVWLPASGTAGFWEVPSDGPIPSGGDGSGLGGGSRGVKTGSLVAEIGIPNSPLSILKRGKNGRFGGGA